MFCVMHPIFLADKGVERLIFVSAAGAGLVLLVRRRLCVSCFAGGTIVVGRVSYCSQVPWITSTSLSVKARHTLGSRKCVSRFAGGPIVVGKVSYCSQVPWIMPASLRDNVTFQRPMQPAQYNAVIDACALNPDLAELPASDLTELGERGVNLSGKLINVDRLTRGRV